MNAKIVTFAELEDADLIVDAVYLGETANNAADDPINVLTRSGNMGGSGKSDASSTPNMSCSIQANRTLIGRMS